MRRIANILSLLLAFITLAAISGVTPFSKAKTTKKTSSKKAEKKSFSEREVISVKILSQTKIKDLLFAPEKGTYMVVADGKNIISIDAQNALKAAIINDSIELKSVSRKL